MAFVHEDFLLSTRTARWLYQNFAQPEPILDFHNHLSPADIASNRRFANLAEVWLEHDHYKWRAMRANGVPERLITGDAAPYEKFLAWAKTVPHTLRNPLYHWTHLELKRVFGIEELLDEQSAPTIWARANEQLAGGGRTVHGILREFNVRALCTTDDPADSLEHHQAIAQSELETKVYPTFRPDASFHVHQPSTFNAWIARLEKTCGGPIQTLDALLTALQQRHDDFHAIGCRLSDHGPEMFCTTFPSEAEAAAIFTKVRAGTAASPQEHAEFIAYVMIQFGRWNAARGWTMQLHVGPIRNNNTRLMQSVGPDAGTDSMSDVPQARGLATFLDRLDRDDQLPRTILYNLNPAANYVFATMAGNFQDGSIPGKIQLGAGWWFLDQKEGMEWQLNTLSNLGLLSRFVGMVTDSRSFMSFPRHEYFRRVLCNLIGNDVEAGLIPNEEPLLAPLIRNLCFANARDYLRLGV